MAPSDRREGWIVHRLQQPEQVREELQVGLRSQPLRPSRDWDMLFVNRRLSHEPAKRIQAYAWASRACPWQPHAANFPRKSGVDVCCSASACAEEVNGR